MKNEIKISSMHDLMFPSQENGNKINPAHVSPLVLAYIGDTVFDLYIRTYLMHVTDCTAHGLHVKSSKLVCASAQAKAAHNLADKFFTEDELYIYKRGRNAHMGTVPKHASIADYRAATGFEAMLGYLYLSGEDARMKVILDEALSILTSEE